MKTLYLWVSGEGWKSFEYTHISELKEEFAKRNIIVSDYANIGYSANIGDSAKIGDSANIGYYAKIGDYANIGHYANIGYYAKIGDSANIGDSAKIGDYANIGYYAKIGDYANIGHYANIGDYANPIIININGSKHFVRYWGEDRIDIGCEKHPIKDWIEIYEKLGKKENYTESEIKEYKGYIDFIANIHNNAK